MLTTMTIYNSYITVSEFCSYNPELDFSSYTDATISGMVLRASQAAANYLQYDPLLDTVVDEQAEAVVSSDGNLVIYTRKIPVVSVQAVTLTIGASQVNLSLTDGNGRARYILPSRAHSIVYPYISLAWTGTMSIMNFFDIRNRDIYTKISYTAGYALDSFPPDMKDAINLLAKDIFIRQANPMNMSSMQQGGISMSFRNPNDANGNTALQNQAYSILNSYKRVIGV